MKDNNKEYNEKKIRVIWDSDNDIPAIYANQLIISHAGLTEFHLVFGHLSPPLSIGLLEDELPEVIKISPVAKIVVSPDTMKKIVDAMKKNLEGYSDEIEGKDDVDE